MTKKFLAYIRVSSTQQGEGVSLQAQREAIERYASEKNLAIVEWFEEMETAAKSGRRAFGRLMRRLRRGGADGVVIHKIDRSARNLRDWADLGEVIDHGIEVHFAGESLDLTSRGGRLTADIQAVVAADYVRNLRDEIKKGLYGRLKQGIYPWPAPVGYLNSGKGRPKEIDPEQGPLVCQAFELYNTGDYSLETLTEEMNRRGLRSLGGRPLYKNSMSLILRNPFYSGVILIRKSGETFQGAHTPLVSVPAWERTQRILDGRWTPKSHVHEFLFRQLFRCGHCGKTLTGELQKGHVYYRCHTRGCGTRSVREEHLDQEVGGRLSALALDPDALAECQEVAQAIIAERGRIAARRRSTLEAQLGQTNTRLERLTDALVDGVLDQEAYGQRRAGLVREQRRLNGLLDTVAAQASQLSTRMKYLLDEASSLSVRYRGGTSADKRTLIRKISSNLFVSGNEVVVELRSPYQELSECAHCLEPPKAPSSNFGVLENHVAIEPHSSDTGSFSRHPVLSNAPQRSDVRTVSFCRHGRKRCRVCRRRCLAGLLERVAVYLIERNGRKLEG